MSVHCKKEENHNYTEHSKDVTDYEWLVLRIAKSIIKEFPPSVSLDDLIQDGYIGAMDALNNYDRPQGASIETYMAIRIRGKILDGLRFMQYGPREKITANEEDGNLEITRKQIEEIKWRTEQRLLRETTEREVAVELGVSLKRYQKYVARAVKAIPIVNTDEEENFKSGWSVRESDISDSTCILDDIIKKETLGIILHVADSLPEREKFVFYLYNKEELFFKEIGAVLGVSESRAHQIYHSGAINKIKDRLKSYKY